MIETELYIKQTMNAEPETKETLSDNEIELIVKSENELEHFIQFLEQKTLLKRSVFLSREPKIQHGNIIICVQKRFSDQFQELVEVYSTNVSKLLKSILVILINEQCELKLIQLTQNNTKRQRNRLDSQIRKRARTLHSISGAENAFEKKCLLIERTKNLKRKHNCLRPETVFGLHLRVGGSLLKVMCITLI
ncbi:Hypothetical_protein [Hexamita inflata]|uniref:Hypothetical_protein n=1 Tax=Hexamita inflata TaxID=28002 RepID=A0AA86PUG5_9EUKA|nr:Hypothetical protein HINF_LOCUS32848 [Hexamita inflata]